VPPLRTTIQTISSELLEALDNGRTIPSIVERNPGFGWDDGYRIAAEILRMRRARGERTVGRKIGFTNRSIWAEYGATAPIWAHVYDRTLVSVESHRVTDRCHADSSRRNLVFGVRRAARRRPHHHLHEIGGGKPLPA
jgi:2-keto-4-pentenoate hydratase